MRLFILSIALVGSAEAASRDSELEQLRALHKAIADLSGIASSRTAFQQPPPPTPPSRRLVDAATGDRVRLRPELRSVRRGKRSLHTRSAPTEVGKIISFQGNDCCVDFPGCANWRGLLSDLELVAHVGSLPRTAGEHVCARAGTLPDGWPSRSAIGVVLRLDDDEVLEQRCIVAFPAHNASSGDAVRSAHGADSDELSSSTWEGPIESVLVVDENGVPLARDEGSSEYVDAMDSFKGLAFARVTPFFQLGWLIGASTTRMAAAQPASLRRRQARGSAGSSADVPEPLRAYPLAAAVGPVVANAIGHLAVLVGTVGLYVSLMALASDSSVSQIVDSAAYSASALLSHNAPPARRAVNADVAARHPGTAALTFILRSPLATVASALLYKLLLLPTLPNLLTQLAHGYEAGRRSVAGRRSASSGQSLSLVTSRSVGLVQLARFSAFWLGGLAAMEWAARLLQSDLS